MVTAHKFMFLLSFVFCFDEKNEAIYFTAAVNFKYLSNKKKTPKITTKTFSLYPVINLKYKTFI